jgi:hypothetical protein
LIRNFITVGGRKSKTSQFLFVSAIIIEHTTKVKLILSVK